MKKRIITLIALLLVSCMTLSGCSGDGIKENSTETINEETVTDTVAPTEAASPDIGSGIDSLFANVYYLDLDGETVGINVGHYAEYFESDNVFRYTDFAKDCGWRVPMENLENVPACNVFYYDMGDGNKIYVSFSLRHQYVYMFHYGLLRSVWPWETETDYYIEINPQCFENDDALISLDEPDYMMANSDGIAIFAYLFLNYPKCANMPEDLFDGVVVQDSNQYALIGY